MFAIMNPPIFTFSSPAPIATPLQPRKYHPSVSSPLSSSPIRASSYSPPLSTLRVDTASIFQNEQPRQIPRDTQSSPILPSQSPSRKLFRFATRTPRPNPVVQKREEAQESRRRLFLKNVRNRADDKAWERRGGDQETLKLEWWRLNNELRREKDAELATFDPDTYIRDAELGTEQMTPIHSAPVMGQWPQPILDDLMVDIRAEEEEAELEALLSSLDTDTDMRSGLDDVRRPDSPHFSDEEDYDALFMDFISQEESRGFSASQDMEMS